LSQLKLPSDAEATSISEVNDAATAHI